PRARAGRAGARPEVTVHGRAGATPQPTPGPPTVHPPLPTRARGPAPPPGGRAAARQGSTCGNRTSGDTFVAVPEVPRFGWRVLLASTALAAIAAAATFVGLGGDDDGPSVDGTVQPTLTLDPEVDVDPDTVAFTTFGGEDVLLSSLRGQPVVVN